jgi:hypothetical protein
MLWFGLVYGVLGMSVAAHLVGHPTPERVYPFPDEMTVPVMRLAMILGTVVGLSIGAFMGYRRAVDSFDEEE